ncbi:MAG: hypothetical protein K2X93_02795 [Candidatus Obscuribacterales bacterium]|nr:hypothetical protein [Candidatus Obscuribacterales bacterium]
MISLREHLADLSAGGDSTSRAAGGGEAHVNVRSELRSSGGTELTKSSSTSVVGDGKLKGTVSFPENDTDLQLNTHSAGGQKDGNARSAATIPPGWVVVGENSNGEVRYGPPDTASNTSQAQVVFGDTNKSGSLDPKRKTLPPTRLDPFVVEKQGLIYGDEGVGSGKLPAAFEEVINSPRDESK